MSLELPLVIVNPAAAGGATGREWPGLAVRIRNNFGPFTVSFTKKPGDAKRIAAEATRAGRRLILACGGDGTLSEAANGILAVDTPNPNPDNNSNATNRAFNTELALLPRGTGGDFRKTLGLSARFEDAARALAEGVTRRIDVGEVNYINLKGHSETRFFINVASFGMGGEVARRANETNKSFGGTAAFAYATLATTLSYAAPEIWLQVDDAEPHWRRISNISVANGCYFGGGMQIAPDAKLNDGLFDMILIRDISTSEMIANSYRLYRGTHLSLPFVEASRAATIVASPVNEREIIRIEIDGEAPGRLPARFRIHPNALAIRTPRPDNSLILK